MRQWLSKFLIVGVSLALCCLPAQAAIFDLDFETDPQDFDVEFYGTSLWLDEGGFEDSGYLNITDAANDQRGAIVFPDLANGEEVYAFTIEADLRVGGGTASPADGFSFNFARPDDPVLDDGEDWAASPTGEANLPEEGTTTGLGIGFDEWFSGGSDVIGMSIRIDNELVKQYSFPVLNGDVNNTRSLQTGPAGVAPQNVLDQLGWAHLSIRLCATSPEVNYLQVRYKDVEVFNEIVDYEPSPGLLVFGGRTGGSNAYHHIDNVSIRTNEDVGFCDVIPPSFVAGEDTIGTRSYQGVASNWEFGPVQDNVSGWSSKLVLVDPATGVLLDNHTIAEDVLDNDDGTVATGAAPTLDDQVAYSVVDMGGGAGTFGSTQPYPNGVADDTMNDFAVRVTADVVIPAGTWSIGFGSDDGGQLTIPGVEFDLWDPASTSPEPDQIRFEAPRGHTWTFGTFTIDEELETTITASFNERGGGDSFEIAVIDGEAIEAPNGTNGWELLGDETLGWSVKTTAQSLVGADLVAEVNKDFPLQFDVNGTTDQADQILVDNPDPNVYTTVMDLDGATFQIKGVGNFANGDSFKIVAVDEIIGNPTIVSVINGQTWTFNPLTGFVTFGTGGVLRGDFNGNGEIDLADIDILTVQSASGDNLPQYDLTGDGLVDGDDVNEWAKAKDIGYTWIGDANYDGQFNTGDFVQVLGIGKYEQVGATAVWSEGDWNGDGVFGTGDLVAALSDGGYEIGPRTDVSAVPEPSAIVLSLLGLAGLVGLTRRR